MRKACAVPFMTALFGRRLMELSLQVTSWGGDRMLRQCIFGGSSKALADGI